jgi:hypothetical protein
MHQSEGNIQPILWYGLDKGGFLTELHADCANQSSGMAPTGMPIQEKRSGSLRKATSTGNPTEMNEIVSE